jgi:hypothetical protein
MWVHYYCCLMTISHISHYTKIERTI